MRVHSTFLSSNNNFSDKYLQIITGCEKIFAESGYEGASMSRIAKSANVSKGTLYHYFTNKADLFAAFLEYKIKAEGINIIDPLNSDRPIEETLRHVALRFIDFQLNPNLLTIHRIIQGESHKFPALSSIYWQQCAGNKLIVIQNWLKQKNKEKKLLIEDIPLACYQFFSLCQAELVVKKRLNLPVEATIENKTRIAQGAVKVFLACYGT